MLLSYSTCFSFLSRLRPLEHPLTSVLADRLPHLNLCFCIFLCFFLLATELGPKYRVTSDGDLCVFGVTDVSDARHRYRCHVRHRLTGDIRPSVSAGSLFVTGEQPVAASLSLLLFLHLPSVCGAARF